MDNIPIHYRFVFDDGRAIDYSLELDAGSLELREEAGSQDRPYWTALEFHKCRNCPLDGAIHENCPVAVNLAPLVKAFATLTSYDKVYVEAKTEERTVSIYSTLQRGISSLLGLIMATSNCPHTIYLRPMARFHLPFASEEETLYRAASMYLLAQYFLKSDGHVPDLDFNGLSSIYVNMEIVNQGIADRLRAIGNRDATVNAVVLLDMLAKVIPYSIKESLEDIRYVYQMYFHPEGRND